MPSIAFIDTEVDPRSHRIFDIGCIKDDGSTFHSPSLPSFFDFINGAEFIAGHNILKHDLPALKRNFPSAAVRPVIDTLYLSALLFPKIPYHKLVKDDKINPDGPNNPFNDAVKARDLFYDEVNDFNKLDEKLKLAYYALLGQAPEFAGFFKFVQYEPRPDGDKAALIRDITAGEACENVDLQKLISEHPIELAYALSLTLRG